MTDQASRVAGFVEQGCVVLRIIGANEDKTHPNSVTHCVIVTTMKRDEFMEYLVAKQHLTGDQLKKEFTKVGFNHGVRSWRESEGMKQEYGVYHMAEILVFDGATETVNGFWVDSTKTLAEGFWKPCPNPLEVTV